MPTVVLTNPSPLASARVAPGGAVPPETSRNIHPQVKKAIELGVRAKALIERGLRSKLVASVIQPAAPEPRPSSTAKTQELQSPGESGAVGTPASTGKSIPARTGSRPPAPRRLPGEQALPLRDARKQEPAEVLARLIVRGDETEFPLRLDRTVIGRSQSASDALDVDLVTVKRGVDRVSRRHAEIIRRGKDFFIRDLGSMNGTFIAGRGKLGRDQLYQLKDRDQVILGGAILQFRRG
jgi:hypothetical protein